MSRLDTVNWPKQEAERWFKQGDHDLMVAQTDYEKGFYSDCCFMSEQAAQKTMNAFLISEGECPMTEYAVSGLIKRARVYKQSFQSLLEKAARLDQYHLPTRYPSFLADPAVPFESYTRQQAAQALAFAQEIFQSVKQKVSDWR